MFPIALMFPRRKRSLRTARPRYACEALECRLLFQAGGPTLYLQGTPGDDNLYLDVSRYKDPARNFAYTYDLDFRGQIYDTSSFGSIVLDTLGGNDHVTVNGLMDHALTINLGNGNDTVQVNYGHPEAGYTGGIFGDTPVTVNGGGGVDALVYSSQEPYVYNIYNVGGSSISNAAFDVDGTVSPPLDVLSYAGIQNLTLFTSPDTAPPNYGPNADFVNVLSSDATLTTVSVPPSRNANFNVAGGVSGPVYCYGGNGTNTFTVDAGVAADVGVTGGTGSSTLNVTGGPPGQTIRVAAGAVGVGAHSVSYSNIGALNVVAGYPSDILDVPSSSIPTSVATTGNLGVVHVGDDPTNPFLARVANILAPVTVNNDALVIDDALDSVGRAVIVGAGSLVGLAPAPINYPPGVSGLTINGGYGSNLFDVTGLPTAFSPTTTLNTGTGHNNDVYVSAPQGLLDVVGQGSPASLTLDDSLLGTGATYTLTATTLNRGLLAITYGGLSALTLNAGPGQNTVNVQGLDPNVSADLVGGAGNDTFNVTAAGRVPTFYGGLYLNGGAGFNSATFNDSADGFFTQSVLTGSTFDHGAGTATYVNLESFAYDTGSLSNIVFVTGTKAGTAYAINGGGGNDGFYVTPIDASGNISVLGPLALSGGGGSDIASFLGSANPNHLTYTVSGSGVVVAGGGVIGGLVTYNGIEALAVDTGAAPEYLTVTGTSVATTITTGGGDVIDVTPVVPNLDAVAGPLTLKTGPGAVLILDDQGDPSFVLTQYFFSGTGLARVTQVYDYSTGIPILIAKGVVINYSGVGSVALHTGAYTNIVQTDGTVSGAPVSIDPSPATALVEAHQTDPTAPVIVEPGGTEAVDVGTGGTASSGGARVLFDAAETIGALTIGPNGTAAITPGGGKILTTPSLSLSAGGRLDVADDLLRIHYGTGADPDPAVATLVGQGAIYSSTLGQGVAVGHRDDTTAQTELVGAGPTVAAFSVNGGAAQRSTVTSLSVAFTQPVALAAGALTLARLTTDAAGNVTSSTDLSSGVAWSSPDGGATWAARVVAGGPADGGSGSLADGVYRVTVRAAAVSGVASGFPLSGGDKSFTFHRLFGDTDGNKTVNALDFAKFKQAFGATAGSAGYNASLDFDGNGAVNALDYAQFKKRFGLTLVYT